MEIKKCVHISDIHIRTFKLHNEYIEVFKTLFEDIKKSIIGFNRDEVRIVLAGDLVHQKIIISNELLLLSTWFLKNLEKIAPVIIIAGNHDLLENNKDRTDSITPMVRLLDGKEITYYKESKCYLEDNIVWCVYSIFEENKRPDIESARVEFGNDKTYIGLFHGPIVSAKTDLGYEIDHGVELDIFEGCDIVMCGDIHKRNAFNHKGVKVNFSSSLIQQNFGENLSKHGFLLWDINDKTYQEIDVENKYGYYKFRITSLNDIETNNEILINK
jgi:DNA repair exonuclease SbcCD nuclease subunit